MLRINILIWLLSPLVVWSQNTSVDTVERVKKSYVPGGIRIGTDVLSIIRSSSSDSFDGWEVSGDIDFDRYYLIVEVGSWSRNLTTNNEVSGFDHYTNRGSYFRVGGDVNFMLKDPDKNMFFLGLRYGRSVFSEVLDAEVVDPLWGSFTQHYQNDNATARWFELTGGIRVKLWKIIWVGYTARYKFGLSTKNTTSMKPHDVPGYGRNDKQSTWGFNYQLFVRLPVRKAK